MSVITFRNQPGGNVGKGIDRTSAKRMAAWRKRMWDEGWKRIDLWLSPEALERLDKILADTPEIKRLVVTELFEEAMAARERKTVTANPVTPEANPVTVMTDREKYRERMILELKTLRQDGLSFSQIATMWNVRGRPTLSGRGQWCPQNLHRLLKSKG